MKAPLFNYSFNIFPLGDQAVTLEFGNIISERIAEEIRGFNNLLKQNPFSGFINCVPAYTTLTIYYDTLTVFYADLNGRNSFEKVSFYLNHLKQETYKNEHTKNAVITIPVCYDEIFGMDLHEVAEINEITTEKVIELHSANKYRVFMIGFTPGFAYLGGMDQRIASPRKPNPRSSIPAGSVGIAGNQTGIYPLQTPGGWQIIGQTPLKMFDIHRDRPSLLCAGDEVMFKPVSLLEFNRLSCL
ncbi:5-oxoprolinase subunit PxpB [Pedobacter sp. GSP4]|uniref:5-oxoprolinase subunit PxpB n=1 Tax=Pedobacter sp. GSP4 TaxID=3453716 RepID=UPI003EEA361B